MSGVRKIVVAGSRSADPDWCARQVALDLGLGGPDGPDAWIEFVSGCAAGADQAPFLLRQWYGTGLRQMPAHWDLHGKSAGYKRNEAMAKYTDEVYVFWDGKSPGSKHMIDLALRYRRRLSVVFF